MSLTQFASSLAQNMGHGVSGDWSEMGVAASKQKMLGLARIITAAMVYAAICIALVPKSLGDEWNKKTIVTFNAPVELPGKALPAGTYVFKLLDSTANRNIIQVWDKDEKHLIATLLAVPDYRLKPADKPVLEFEERASNTPEAIKAFFYPGDNYGLEFVYPHDQAVELAKRTNRNVLSMRNEMAKNITTQSKSASDASVQQLEKTDVSGVNPAGDAVELDVVILEKPER